jgi:hypothetical protein
MVGKAKALAGSAYRDYVFITRTRGLTSRIRDERSRTVEEGLGVRGGPKEVGDGLEGLQV